MDFPGRDGPAAGTFSGCRPTQSGSLAPPDTAVCRSGHAGWRVAVRGRTKVLSHKTLGGHLVMMAAPIPRERFSGKPPGFCCLTYHQVAARCRVAWSWRPWTVAFMAPTWCVLVDWRLRIPATVLAMIIASP
jgi:hypothetical protein